MNLTDDEIRIKVAESLPHKEPHWWCFRCGKVESTHVTYEERHGIDSCMERVTWVEGPNYPQDLNACAEFEETLTEEEQASYVLFLNTQHPNADILFPDQTERGFAQKLAVEVFGLATATARQRCLAFLKVKGILP